MNINEIQLWNNEEENMADEETLGCKILIGLDGTIYEMYEDPKSLLQFVTEVFGKYTPTRIQVNDVVLKLLPNHTISVRRPRLKIVEAS